MGIVMPGMRLAKSLVSLKFSHPYRLVVYVIFPFLLFSSPSLRVPLLRSWAHVNPESWSASHIVLSFIRLCMTFLEKIFVFSFAKLRPTTGLAAEPLTL